MRTARSRDPRRVRYAVVGLGHIAQVAILPAFAHARRNSELVALVSEDTTKRRKLSRRYRVPLAFPYDEYDTRLREGGIDAVYIALPNDMHRAFAERAARAGVHVLCEKPLAPTVRDCQAIIRTADRHGVKLMTAYRLHFEEGNLAAVELGRRGRLGELRLFDSVFTLQARTGNIRLEAERAGGPLYDIGIYCINAARYLFRSEPRFVTAVAVRGGGGRFQEVEEAMSVVLEFPDDRLASFTCSFGAADVSAYRLVGTKGNLTMEPAYEYAEGLRSTLVVGATRRVQQYPKRDQFAAELLHFSDCILRDRQPEPSGAEGLNDIRIIEAIQRAVKTGRRQAVRRLEAKGKRPSMSQEIRRPAVDKPRLVKVASGSR